MLTGVLSSDRTYDIIEAAEAIAKELGTTTARVALAWVQARPGVSSTIIGARTLDQLDDNLVALEVKLPPQAVAKLDEVSKPKLNFPAEFLGFIGSFGYGGTTISRRELPGRPQCAEERRRAVLGSPLRGLRRLDR